MSKQTMREEAERLIREAMAKKPLTVKQGNTRIDAICGKCGAPNRVQAEKGASLEEMDAALKANKAMPIGQYTLMDSLGLDTVLHVAEFMDESLGERFYVDPKLRELVAGGHLGTKTGKGYYDHA